MRHCTGTQAATGNALAVRVGYRYYITQAGIKALILNLTLTANDELEAVIQKASTVVYVSYYNTPRR